VREAEIAREEKRLKEQVAEVAEKQPAYGYRRLLPEPLALLSVEDGVVISSRGEWSQRQLSGLGSFWSRFKAENHSLVIESETLAEVIGAVDRQMTYSNTRGRHSRVAYKTPLEYLHTERMLSGSRSRN
jgi:hypothetical protein